MEKARSNFKNCDAVLTEDGGLEQDIEKILELQKIFYQDLYTSDTDISFNLKNNTVAEIPRDSAGANEEQLTEQEIYQAVKDLNNGKTPGPDGIPIEFYKILWVDIKDVLIPAIYAMYECKQLNDSATRGILNQIRIHVKLKIFVLSRYLTVTTKL